MIPVEGGETKKTEAADSTEKTKAVVPSTDATGKDETKFAVSNQSIWFQLLLALASIYYAMLLTNWGSPEFGDDESYVIMSASPKMSFWI